MSRWSRWDNHYFPPSRPLDAKGGIMSQARRGAFGESWWARRWISVLESFQIGARLQRGRAYARKGQALSIDIEKGIVHAQVQGSRPRPYRVTIRIRPLADAQWEKLEAALAAAPIYAARLPAGEMPQDIEKVFDQAGAPLFPQAARDLETECSCPDWSTIPANTSPPYTTARRRVRPRPFSPVQAARALPGGNRRGTEGPVPV